MDYNEILRNPELKAVTIATPAATHYEFVKKKPCLLTKMSL